MKLRTLLLLGASLLALNLPVTAQGNPKPDNPTTAVVSAFATHDIVMLGEMHGNKQEYAWLPSLVASPEFADRADDIVLEMGNSLYQSSVDRYISGEDVPLEQVQKTWRNTVAVVGPPSPTTALLFQTVREENIKRKGKHQMRVICGDPYIDWEKVKDRKDISPYAANREQWFAQVVKDEVLSKHHRAFLIMGSAHFLRVPPFPRRISIEHELQAAGAKTYLIVAGTNTPRGYDDIDHRFDSWPTPSIVPLTDNWVGELPAYSIISGGGAEGYQWMFSSESASAAPVKMKDVADALLYLGPRDTLLDVFMTRGELEGTPYENEIERRLTLEGMPLEIVPALEPETSEAPQFSRPKIAKPEPPAAPAPAPAPQAQPTPPPKALGPPPLPPRPPSQ